MKRAKSMGILQVSHELVALSSYIKMNLHVEENHFVALADDFMVELDLAMAVRRIGIPGQATPQGQLTRFEGTPTGNLLDYINKSNRPDVHRLGEIFLSMDGEAANVLNRGLRKIMSMTLADSKHHDFSIALKGGGGISVHCNLETRENARTTLLNHCEMRKYALKVDRWYGITIDPHGSPVMMTGLEFPWVIDAALERQVAPYRQRNLERSPFLKRKVGRNDACPCGSGRKFKRCCLN
ncbi:YecA family protein [Parafrankia sp. BMG5.11]|uniref:YecA family protein n=1 Tax=Parafrankia sp. BMG5.11 TaxID=222540 RepID=UPI001405463A|nr:SEC-C metal-binding domain-containing protein [Parafrankia sp. BMG5.11]